MRNTHETTGRRTKRHSACVSDVLKLIIALFILNLIVANWTHSQRSSSAHVWGEKVTAWKMGNADRSEGPDS